MTAVLLTLNDLTFSRLTSRKCFMKAYISVRFGITKFSGVGMDVILLLLISLCIEYTEDKHKPCSHVHVHASKPICDQMPTIFPPNIADIIWQNEEEVGAISAIQKLFAETPTNRHLLSAAQVIKQCQNSRTHNRWSLESGVKCVCTIPHNRKPQFTMCLKHIKR